MDFALIALLKPILYIALYVFVIHWILKFFWKIIPDGKLKEFLFRRR